jgi:L-ascorbate metabolism protein UlaG (beta-lactamase superfamily)
MIAALQKDEILQADVNAIASDDACLHLWWLGQSGFLCQQGGARLLLDPYLSDSLTEKYAATDKPHVRMTERCLAPEALPQVRLVTASHIHTDHLDAATLVPLAHAMGGITLVLPHPILEDARLRLGDAPIELVGLDAGESCELHGWRLTGIPAMHDDLKKDEHCRHHYLGFLIQRAGFCFYHSGDTRWYPDLAKWLLDPVCDVMLLPINGHKPERRVAGNMDGTEAGVLAKSCQARLAVPCHYDMFTFNTESPEEFMAACTHLAQPHRVLRCGEKLSLELHSGVGSA